MNDNVKIKTEAGKATVELVGGARPYLWLGVDGRYLDSIDFDDLRELRDQITAAIRAIPAAVRAEEAEYASP